MKIQRSLIKSIVEIYRLGQAYISPKTSEYGVGRGQWYFFNRLLFQGDGISQEQLSAEMYVDSAHTARAIKKLEDDGFIFRRPDDRDGRKKNVFLADRSHVLREDYHEIFKDLNGILTKGFNAEELELARSLLSRMKDNISSYMEDDL